MSRQMDPESKLGILDDMFETVISLRDSDEVGLAVRI